MKPVTQSDQAPPLKGARPGQVWVGSVLVFVVALAWLGAAGIDARMTDDSVRDLHTARLCAEQPCGFLGTTSISGLMHGTLWMRALIAARHHGLSPLTQVGVLLVLQALAAAVVFATVAPLGGWAKAAWTSALFVLLGAGVGFPELTNAYAGFLPSAVFFLGVSRIVAGRSIAWPSVAGIGLYLAVEFHASSLALLPVLLGATAAAERLPRRQLSIAVASWLVPAAVLSRDTYLWNLRLNGMATTLSALGAIGTVALALRFRPWWTEVHVDRRLGIVAGATVVGWLGLEALGGLITHREVSLWYPIPILVPMAVVFAFGIPRLLARFRRPGTVLLAAVGLCFLAAYQQMPLLAPMDALVGVLLVSWALRAPVVHRAIRGVAQLSVLVYAVVLGRLATTDSLRTDWIFVQSTTIRAAQTLGEYLAGHGWSCADARTAEGRAILSQTRAHPFVCLMLDVDDDASMKLPAVLRLLPAKRAQVPASGLAGWDALDFGHGRLGLVSSIVPWVPRNLGRGTLRRGNTELAAFDLRYYWDHALAGPWETAFSTDVPLKLERLVPGYSDHAMGDATASYEFPIRITGDDPERDVDLLASPFIPSKWRIDAVEGVDHVLSPSGFHVKLRNGPSKTGVIRFVREPKGDHPADLPLDLVETTPNEDVIRALLPNRVVLVPRD